MPRIALCAALALLSSLGPLAAPAFAQAHERETSATSARDLQEGTQQHRIGTALLAVGLTANLLGGAASFYTIVYPSWSAEGCVSSCPASPDRVPGIAAALTTAGVGLVLFFVGLGLDIHGRILRGQAAPAPTIALDGGGLTVLF